MTLVNTASDANITATAAAERHPAALPVLFFTEMWERFSYYGMRALLVLYLVNAVGYTRTSALALYATYTSLVYFSPLIGGYLADRYLGRRKAILIGGITMALGHFCMAFEPLLHLSLGLLIIGNGFFKPNISTLLGSLYRENDPRRDGGFTIFYMGVNLGAFLAPFVAGTLGEKVGWHYGFASAGVGMCLGIAQFLWGQHKLGTAGLPAGKSKLDGSDWMHILLIAFGMIPLVFAILGVWGLIGPTWSSLPIVAKLAIVAGIIAALWFGSKAKNGDKAKVAEPLTRDEWHRIIAILIMGFFVVFFWMGFEQAGGTMNLFADKQTDRHLGNWEIPASYFQAINPMGIVLMGPILAMIWTRLDQSRFKLPAPAKMGLGMIILGLGFIVLAIAQTEADTVGKVGPQWLFFVYLLHTIGELCLSPVGLSMVTKLAPARVAAMMMGIWYLANALANYLAGTLEELLKGSSFPLYGFLVASSIGAGTVLLVISPLIKKLMHGR
ncbi:peptide MFS transporter [Undibacterium sp.]|jgi:POT family proton-dependent oligopeptide transporter|uniref:peptide MFS transporter n=1 Tax=Undibacterium sp. TaxID=1914977 RepID=UPI002B9DA718|nr:peptide MFS transporter [Undibacterium sp.]HTD05788.1 peptide MFS transporter [Undibacterium sp.]